MIIMIDNYDSFTYTLVQYFQILHQEVAVFYHDKISLLDIEALSPSHLVLSPGPNSPNEAGISLAAIEHFYKDLPILGVCLGHQCLAQAFGGRIVPAKEIIHGQTSVIHHRQKKLFHHIKNPFKATRYHSLAVEEASLPSCLEIDAWSDDNTIMAISHSDYPLYGVQFHPEAILTEYGLEILKNFICLGNK